MLLENDSDNGGERLTQTMNDYVIHNISAELGMIRKIVVVNI